MVFFSYRWSQIFDQGSIPKSHTYLCATQTGSVDGKPQFSPHALDQVLEKIREERPSLVCAPHVETSMGLILTDDYIREVAKATHEVGGLFCLDGIASGNMWVNMKDLGVDIYISAPQKGWSAPASCAVVMMT